MLTDIRFLKIAVVLLCGGAVLQTSSSFATDSRIRLSSDMDLTPTIQSRLGSEASKGSPEAARRLANFHFIVRGDRQASLKWYTIGAENGDAACAYGLYQLLDASADENDRARAEF